MIDWLEWYIAIFISFEVPLTMVLISYYRRFWKVIRAMGLETAPSAQAKADKMFEGAPKWWKGRK